MVARSVQALAEDGATADPYPRRNWHRPAAYMFEAWHDDNVHDQVLDLTAWARNKPDLVAWCLEALPPPTFARRKNSERAQSGSPGPDTRAVARRRRTHKHIVFYPTP